MVALEKLPSMAEMSSSMSAVLDTYSSMAPILFPCDPPATALHGRHADPPSFHSVFSPPTGLFRPLPGTGDPTAHLLAAPYMASEMVMS